MKAGIGKMANEGVWKKVAQILGNSRASAPSTKALIEMDTISHEGSPKP
jgi:hypothetical protein